ncbi:MAG: hypothetical protein FWH31_05525 [Streptococcaceae bacterium]|nr:hypothetical protein [Streptococcaceae bacterium]
MSGTTRLRRPFVERCAKHMNLPLYRIVVCVKAAMDMLVVSSISSLVKLMVEQSGDRACGVKRT